MLNKEFVIRKLQLISEDLNQLKPFADKTLNDVAKSSIEQAAVERYLERIITRAIDVNQHIITELGNASISVKTYRDTFLALADLDVYSKDFAEQIAPSAGLRNVLIHEYDQLDHQLLNKSIQQAIVEFNSYSTYILDFVNNTDQET